MPSNDRSWLPSALLDPAAYPHTPSAVTVRETHISWVFLTGRYAYKVKKPVATPFLDFSTLERRRFYCEEEVRLNQRFARELYLGVVPITGSAEHPRVGGIGEPLEYAVQMRQFPEEALLSRMIAAGTLRIEHIDALARMIAEVHQRATPAEPTSPWGRPAEIVKPALDNFDLLAQDLDDADRHAAAELRAWTEAAAQRLPDVWQQRRAAGWVRECHGDLHLGNLLWWGGLETPLGGEAGRITPFDCIEFNPSLRWIDVVSDVAFTVMDLADRGRPDFAHRLQNAWLEETGDYSGLAVWRWYLVYRAMVRAKVASLRAAQEQDAPDAHRRSLREAGNYIHLAEASARPSAPRLIITHGVSGSGKTTGAQLLVDRLGAIRIRSDVERKRLAGLAPTAASHSGVAEGLYTPARTAQTYTALVHFARQSLHAGYTTVVDAAFLRRADRDQFRRLAGECGVPFVIVPFEAAEGVLLERLASRRGDASEATAAVLRKQLADQQPLESDERPFCQTLEQLVSPHDRLDAPP